MLAKRRMIISDDDKTKVLLGPINVDVNRNHRMLRLSLFAIILQNSISLFPPLANASAGVVGQSGAVKAATATAAAAVTAAGSLSTSQLDAFLELITPFSELLFPPILGQLSDYHGRKKLLFLSAYLISLGHLVTAFFSPSSSSLISKLKFVVDNGLTPAFITIAAAAQADMLPEERHLFGAVARTMESNALAFLIGPIISKSLVSIFKMNQMSPEKASAVAPLVSSAIALSSALLVAFGVDETAVTPGKPFSFVQLISSPLTSLLDVVYSSQSAKFLALGLFISQNAGLSSIAFGENMKANVASLVALLSSISPFAIRALKSSKITSTVDTYGFGCLLSAVGYIMYKIGQKHTSSILTYLGGILVSFGSIRFAALSTLSLHKLRTNSKLSMGNGQILATLSTIRFLATISSDVVLSSIRNTFGSIAGNEAIDALSMAGSLLISSRLVGYEDF